MEMERHKQFNNFNCQEMLRHEEKRRSKKVVFNNQDFLKIIYKLFIRYEMYHNVALESYRSSKYDPK